MKYCDEILQMPLHLSTHIMEGRVKILETYQYEEIIKYSHSLLNRVMSHVPTSTFSKQVRTKPNEITDIVLISGPGNWFWFS